MSRVRKAPQMALKLKAALPTMTASLPSRTLSQS
jgi:hypothetical protein